MTSIKVSKKRSLNEMRGGCGGHERVALILYPVLLLSFHEQRALSTYWKGISGTIHKKTKVQIPRGTFHIILSGHKFASQCSSSPVGDHSQFEFAFLSCLEGFLLRFCGCFIECDSRSNMIENKCIVNSVLRIARSFAFEHSGVQKQYNIMCQCSSHCKISKLFVKRSTCLSF